jgi:hypothetical protein
MVLPVRASRNTQFRFFRSDDLFCAPSIWAVSVPCMTLLCLRIWLSQCSRMTFAMAIQGVMEGSVRLGSACRRPAASFLRFRILKPLPESSGYAPFANAMSIRRCVPGRSITQDLKKLLCIWSGGVSETHIPSHRELQPHLIACQCSGGLLFTPLLVLVHPILDIRVRSRAQR